MKKIRLFSILMALMLVVMSCGLFAVQADTQPADVNTQPIVTEPVPTQPITDPVFSNPEGSEPVTNPTDYVGPTDATDVPTEPVTEGTRPTEYDEDNQPNTYSDYVSPAPIYTPADQDFEKNEWEAIELDLNSSSGGTGDFLNIKNNTSKGDQKSPLLIILCVVFWCLALSALTFMILYKPKNEKAPAYASRKQAGKSTSARHAQQSRASVKRSRDDYNDGF